MLIKLFNRKYKNIAKEARQNCILYCYYMALIVFDKESDFDINYSRGLEAFNFIDKELGNEETENLDFKSSSLVSWLKSDGYIYSLIACKEKTFYQYLLNDLGGRTPIFSIRYLLKKYRKSKSIAKKKDQTLPLRESSKETKKRINKKIKKHRDTKVREEAISRYGNIKLPKVNLALVSSVSTILILASSLYYNKELFSSLNLPIEGILTPSDYIYSSFTFIIYLFFSLLISAIFIILMLKNLITNEIKEETFGLTSDKQKNELSLVASVIIFLNSSALLLLFHDLEKAQTALDTLLPLNITLVVIYFLKKAPFHFFEKPRRAYMLFLTLILFISATYNKTQYEIKRIVRESSNSRFEIKRKSNNKYYDLIKSTEKYVIIRNKDQSFTLIPNADVSEIKRKH
ncbi:hypothetical protein HHX48_07315 [Salinimonas sp. HHU 13199]|uniref:Uncharacterized protein n=1 Tax=Salinimonas profundi TaxID=2729140 RepID=A0ABR8LMC1_9ALTE|nr:hypothetical protein [Salinimonas profundi]MBD3585537.1 hypothetical protein [Salinimonas profundi]